MNRWDLLGMELTWFGHHSSLANLGTRCRMQKTLCLSCPMFFKYLNLSTELSGPPLPSDFLSVALLMDFTSFSSVQLSRSVVSNSATPWTAAPQASLSITNSWSLLKLMSVESVMPSNQLIFCHPLLLPPSIFPSIRIFSNESVLRIRWLKYWRFSMRPSNEYSGLISFRMDWLDLLTVQGTLKSLFQHHSSKASILQCSAFFMVQLSHPYTTTGKTIALTRRTFVGRVMSLLFNMLLLSLLI